VWTTENVDGEGRGIRMMGRSSTDGGWDTGEEVEAVSGVMVEAEEKDELGLSSSHELARIASSSSAKVSSPCDEEEGDEATEGERGSGFANLAK
jgi:hypothetical protein